MGGSPSAYRRRGGFTPTGRLEAEELFSAGRERLLARDGFTITGQTGEHDEFLLSVIGLLGHATLISCEGK